MNSPCLLLVDDQPDNIRVLLGLLKDAGYTLRVANSGQQALELARQEAPDLVLLDIFMPEMDGFETCRRLKADPATASIPVIFVTAAVSTAEKLTGFECGGVDYVTKPFEAAEVLARVHTHATLQQTQRQLQVHNVMLNEQNDRFHALEEAAFDGLLIHHNGRILDLNQTAANLFEASSDALIGSLVTDLLPDMSAGPCEDGVHSDTPEVHVEVEALTVRQRRFPADIQSRSIPWKGKNVCVTAIRDISQRKAMQQRTLELEAENLSLRATLQDRQHLGELTGKSPAMQMVYERIVRAAASDETAIVYGETGVGKELVARTIFALSERHTRNFVAVNCGAVQETLFESAFFGYRKGAFSGAAKDTPGYFAQAEGGTLFLDEVGELTLPMQIKLLRVLNDGSYTPVGEGQEQQADVRIIAATNRELRDLVRQGTVREDFFHRLHVLALEIPPLRYRKEDLPLLIQHFLQQHAVPDAPLPNLPPDLFERFLAYDWPGNVRELFNELRRWHTLGEVELSGELPETPADTVEALPFLHDEMNLYEALAAFEEFYLTQAMQQHENHRGNAAKQLGINRKTLYEKLKKYGH